MSGHHESRQPLAVVLAISGCLFVAEVVGAVVSGSLALLADAGHVLADVAGFGLALGAAVLAARPATPERTWGYRRAEVLAAAAQAAVLLAVGVVVLVEAVRHLVSPEPVAGIAMLCFGLVALIGNGVSLAVLAGRRGTNLSLRAAFLEVASDALGATAVLIAAVIVATTGWLRADAVASLAIGALILPRTWRLLRETVDVLMETTPKHVDMTDVRRHLLDVEHVQAVHDLHAFTVASDLPVLTAHVVVDDDCFASGHVPQLLDQVQRCLGGHFDVVHSTFQFEPASHAAHESAMHA